MKYGYFDDSKKEYIIENPKTPVKWINYIGNLDFGGFVDHTGGTLLCKGDPALNRITKYIPQMPSSDFKGETLYIRLKDGNEYKVFSPLFVPTLDKYDLYECHVGLSYTKIVSEFYGIRTEILIFVPRNDHREIRKIKITNLNEEPLQIDLIPVVEYTHYDALKQITNADWVPQTMQSRVIDDGNGLKVLTQYAFMNKDSNVNFLTSNLPVSSFESDRKRFLGDNEYGTYKFPLSLKCDELSNYETQRGDNIGALMQHIGKLSKGDSKTIILQLGQYENINDEKKLIDKYRVENNVDKEFSELIGFWEEYLSKIKVNTPDAGMNTMLNIHNPRQCYITKNWSRYLSLYQLGFGGRGMGFRDSAQDVMGVISHIPDEGLELIHMLISTQKADGSAMHQFNPLTMEANEGDSREMEDGPNYYGDDHLWIILSVCSYLKESGNIDFLSKELPYYDKDKAGKPVTSATVLEHLKCAIEFTKNNTGFHGIPLLGFADWNDTVNLEAGAESLFIANLYGEALKEMIELFEYLGDTALAEEYTRYYEEMKEKVNEYAWDGEWYVRYFDNDGNAIGSKNNSQGKIYINSQVWAVISGFADNDRCRKSLDSVYKLLNTKNGLKLSWPGYNGYDREKGGITTYPPGAKENGGIFLHCNPWAIIAEVKMGNGNRAYQYYNQINPVYKNEIIDEYECEPYCYPQNILGDEHVQFGLGRNSWLSGTSSWVYQAAVKHILGVMPGYDYLVIDPCIPEEWPGFKMTRHFRNIKYEIEVKNPHNVCRGLKTVKVDDVLADSNKIPVFNDDKTHSIEVIMG